MLPFYAYDAILYAAPPALGEETAIEVRVANDGGSAAAGVEVRLAVNEWSVGFGGWEEIGRARVDVEAGAEASVVMAHAFSTRGARCVQAQVREGVEGGNADTGDDRGQINGLWLTVDGDLLYGVPVRNARETAVTLSSLRASCVDAQYTEVTCPGKLELVDRKSVV